MPGKRIPMRKISEVLRLKFEAKLSQAKAEHAAQIAQLQASQKEVLANQLTQRLMDLTSLVEASEIESDGAI